MSKDYLRKGGVDNRSASQKTADRIRRMKMESKYDAKVIASGVTLSAKDAQALLKQKYASNTQHITRPQSEMDR